MKNEDWLNRPTSLPASKSTYSTEYITRLAGNATRMVKDPCRAWKREGRFVSEAIKRFHDTSSLVVPMRSKAESICAHNAMLVRIFIDGCNDIQINGSWDVAFFKIMAFCVNKHKELLQAFYRTRKMPWLSKKNPNLSLAEAIRCCNISEAAGSPSEICRIIQWLLIVTSHPLNNCFVVFVGKSESAKSNLIKKSAKSKDTQPTSPKKAKRKKKSIGRHPVLEGMGFASISTSNSVDYSTHQSRGAYVIKDGVVQFLSKVDNED